MKTAALWVPAIAVIFLIFAAQGCALDEIATVDVPRDIQKTMGTGDTVTLREARQMREQVVDRQQASLRAFDREIADGAFFEQLAGSAINDVLPIAVPMLGELPGGTILASLLVGFAGWMSPRPGEAKKKKAAEDKGYDMGRNETLDSLAKAPIK